VLNGPRNRLTQEKAIGALPLAERAVHLVVDCTGVLIAGSKVQRHFEASARKVVVSARSRMTEG
jgi:glyceraldehyde-3-phosphate dehydrogenase/erythrose-4-phosphate dehydrogenase